MTTLLILAIRDKDVNVWAVARVVLVNMCCRPDVFRAAAAGVAAAAPPSNRTLVAESLAELSGAATRLQPTATATEGKDAFARDFYRWAKGLRGKM
jgi:hypothetical protein